MIYLPGSVAEIKAPKKRESLRLKSVLFITNTTNEYMIPLSINNKNTTINHKRSYNCYFFIIYIYWYCEMYCLFIIISLVILCKVLLFTREMFCRFYYRNSHLFCFIRGTESFGIIF